MPGAAISEVEVSNISKHGFWLLLDGDELFLPFREFPWFKKATRRSDSPAGAAGAGASLLARSRRRPGRRVDQAPRAIPAQIGPLTSRHRTHRRGVIRAETKRKQRRACAAAVAVARRVGVRFVERGYEPAPIRQPSLPRRNHLRTASACDRRGIPQLDGVPRWHDLFAPFGGSRARAT